MIQTTHSLGTPIPISRWCLSKQRRWLDAIAATIGLVLLSPMLLIIALAVVVGSGMPIIFRQCRVGRSYKEFELLKFRTMTMIDTKSASGLTQRGDSRVTHVGRLLRKWKLDELPQLVNVLRGDMTFVGPRPDMKHFWEQAAPADRRILSLPPGLTGAASIAYWDEESLLAQVSAESLNTFYIKQIMPAKAKLDCEYAARETLWTDCMIILQTLSMPLLNHRNNKKEAHAQISWR
jgi:lipopolysaccharide/colanic/teichoic acid biosynthesis glycosyltransferase